MLGVRNVLRLQGELGCLQKINVPAAAWFFHTAPSLPFALHTQSHTEENRQVDKTYVDRLKVTARAGNGGNGCISFWRSASKGKYTPADGGNGGGGGHVIIRASTNVKSLAGVPQLMKGESGKHGSRQKLQGRRGTDKVLLVPTGTVVSKLIEVPSASSSSVEYSSVSSSSSSRFKTGKVEVVEESEIEEDVPQWLQDWRKPWRGQTDYRSGGEEEEEENGEEEDPSKIENSMKSSRKRKSSSNDGADDDEQGYQILADLIEDGQEVIAAVGGRGGRGNAAERALPRRPAPSTCEPPAPGEVSRLLLELKLIADVALVGLPNVGKSSLLRVISDATPKVGSYAFTTLKAQLGAVMLGGGRQVVVTDVPGLIKGAHEDRGLGHRFLRHVERASALAFVVDASGTRSKSKSTKLSSSGSNELPPWEQLELVRGEVAEYSPELLQRPWIVIANKIDLLKRPAATLAALRRRGLEAGASAVIGVAARSGGGEGDSSDSQYSDGGEAKGVKELVAALEELVFAEK